MINVQAAINAILLARPNMASYPAEARPFVNRGSKHPSTCYVILKREVEFDTNREPRCDLLGLWLEALIAYAKSDESRSAWEVAWAPAKDGVDKRLWIQLRDVSAVAVSRRNETESELEN